MVNSEHAGRAIAAGVLRRSLVSLAVFLLVLALALFLPAGIDWTAGWIFLAVFVLQIAIAALYLWRRNPEIFVARSKFHAGTKWWDWVAVSFLLPSLMAMFPVAALDYRWHWSSVPLWVIVAGYMLLTIGMLGSISVEAVNKFAEPGCVSRRNEGTR